VSRKHARARFSTIDAVVDGVIDCKSGQSRGSQTGGPSLIKIIVDESNNCLNYLFET
jgi:hypothetical protein